MNKEERELLLYLTQIMIEHSGVNLEEMAKLIELVTKVNDAVKKK